MFKFLKKKSVEFYTPVNGRIVQIEEVPDPVFNKKMMGEGIAVEPSDGTIHAPVNGIVILVAVSKHAIGIRTDTGSEVLVHVGLETVSLNGVGFQVLVKEGDEVSVGQVLMEVDLGYIKVNGKNLVTPIVITNSQSNGKKYTFTKEVNAEVGRTVIFKETN